MVGIVVAIGAAKLEPSVGVNGGKCRTPARCTAAGPSQDSSRLRVCGRSGRPAAVGTVGTPPRPASPSTHDGALPGGSARCSHLQTRQGIRNRAEELEHRLLFLRAIK